MVAVKTLQQRVMHLRLGGVRDWTSSEQHSPGGNSKVRASLDSRATLAKYPLTHPVSVALFIAPPPPQTPPANEGVSESRGR
ncbi:hypothetical protein SRHO_G00126800 [Serrasalmus rhombeus]